MTARRDPESGVILVNVLVALAIGATLVTLMMTSQDNLLDRARRSGAVAQAEALARGAEASVVVALRRDMAEAPTSDHYGEAWALAQQEAVTLDNGRFEVRITDAQARFDLNAIASGGIVQLQTLGRLVAALDLPPEVAEVIALELARSGPVDSLAEIPGLDPDERARLDPFVVFLPGPGLVNLNTADPFLLGVLVGNRNAAARLLALRTRPEGLTPDDLQRAGLISTGALGLTSDVYDVTTLADVDGMTVTMTTRLLRQTGPGGNDVLPVARHFGIIQ